MGYKIPLFKLNFDGREAAAAAETIRSGWISTGPKCEELERRFGEMLGVPYAVSLSSCTSALHVACLVCGFGPGDEVLCPSLTFAASANCIRYVGATPVFCDIVGPDHPNIDPQELERRLTPRTRGLVVVHLAGFPARMDEIMAFARRHGLKVIEDACHGPLSEYKGRKLGGIGDCAAFSFFSNKNISAGEGGMFVTARRDLAEKARLLRSHGMTTLSYQRAGGHATAYDIVELGYNFRLDDIRASIALEQLRKLPGDLERRSRVRRRYVEGLAGVEGVTVPFADHREFVSNYIFPVVLTGVSRSGRDAVRERLHTAGIQTSIHYPAIHRFSIYAAFRTALPRTEYVSDHEITLPMYAALTDGEVDYIVKTLDEALHGPASVQTIEQAAGCPEEASKDSVAVQTKNKTAGCPDKTSKSPASVLNKEQTTGCPDEAFNGPASVPNKEQTAGCPDKASKSPAAVPNKEQTAGCPDETADGQSLSR